MHRNAVTRGLVLEPEQWRWSSYRHYACEESVAVLVNGLQRAELKGGHHGARHYLQRWLLHLTNQNRYRFAVRIVSIPQRHGSGSNTRPRTPGLRLHFPDSWIFALLSPWLRCRLRALVLLLPPVEFIFFFPHLRRALLFHRRRRSG